MAHNKSFLVSSVWLQEIVNTVLEVVPKPNLNKREWQQHHRHLPPHTARQPTRDTHRLPYLTQHMCSHAIILATVAPPPSSLMMPDCACSDGTHDASAVLRRKVLLLPVLLRAQQWRQGQRQCRQEAAPQGEQSRWQG